MIEFWIGNGLVPSDCKPLPERMLTTFYDNICRNQGYKLSRSGGKMVSFLHFHTNTKSFYYV